MSTAPIHHRAGNGEDANAQTEGVLRSRMVRTGRRPSGRTPARRRAGAFTLIEILLSLALIAVVLVALNSFVFSMGELWGKNSDVRLFDQHVRAVTHFLNVELRKAALPPAAVANSSPFGLDDVRTQDGGTQKLLTFELLGGSHIFNWPDRPLPEVVCSLEVRPNVGLVILWHSRLEMNFDSEPPRETVLTPLVTAMSYDYYDSDTNTWSTDTSLKLDGQGNPMTPQRIRLTFTYKKLTRTSVITLPVVGQGLPSF